MSKHVKKITLKEVGLTLNVLETHAEQSANIDEEGNITPVEVPVLRVYGRINKQNPGTTHLGPYINFQGEHEGINVITGEKYRSRNLILPELAEMSIAHVVDSVHAEAPDSWVEYGCDVTVQYYVNANKSGTKYKFGVRPLRESSGEDYLSKLGNEFPALPAPITA